MLRCRQEEWRWTKRWKDPFAQHSCSQFPKALHPQRADEGRCVLEGQPQQTTCTAREERDWERNPAQLSPSMNGMKQAWGSIRGKGFCLDVLSPLCYWGNAILRRNYHIPGEESLYFSCSQGAGSSIQLVISIKPKPFMAATTPQYFNSEVF